MNRQLVLARLDYLRRAIARIPDDAEIIEVQANRTLGIGGHAAIELANPDDVRVVAINAGIPMLHENLGGERRAVCFAAGVEFYAREEAERHE